MAVNSLICFNEAVSLAADIKKTSLFIRGPGAQKVGDQMRRAADSIYALIAEGYGRGVTKDGLNYFRMARSSCDELEGHLRAAIVKDELDPEVVEPLIDHCIRVRFLIFRFMLSIERRMAEKERREIEEAKRKRRRKSPPSPP